VVRRLRVPARRPRSVRHTTTWSLAGGWPSQPLVRSNWCRPTTRTF
jgi:hypothetical protein